MNITTGKRYHLGFDPYARGFNSQQLDAAYSRLTLDSRDAALICECASMEEVDAEYNVGEIMAPLDLANMLGIDAGRMETEEMILEAVRVKKFSRTQTTMAALGRAMNKHMADKGLSVGEAIIGKPKKTGLFASVTVQFPISDGQTISIIFHSPDNNKMKITPDDEILAFRWLLNKRDITVAVSPEGEADVSLEEVGKRVAMLSEKNSARFQSMQKEIVEQKKALEDLKAQADAATAANQDAMNRLAEAQKAAETMEAEITRAQSELAKVQAFNAELEAKLDSLKAQAAASHGDGGTAPKTAEAVKAEQDAAEFAAAEERFKSQVLSLGFKNVGNQKFRIGYVGEMNRKPFARDITTNYFVDQNNGSVVVNAADKTFKSKSTATAGNAFDKAIAALESELKGKETIDQWRAKYQSAADQFKVGEVYSLSRKTISSSFKDDTTYMSGYVVKDVDSTEHGGSMLPAVEFSSEHSTVRFRYDVLQQMIDDQWLVREGKEPMPPSTELNDADFESLHADFMDAMSERGAAKNNVGTYSIIKGDVEITANLAQQSSSMIVLAANAYNDKAKTNEKFYFEGMKTKAEVAARISEFAAWLDEQLTAAPETTDLPAVATLNSILAGDYSDSATISNKLDEAAEELSSAGLMEKYDALLNEAADYLTEILSKEAV